MLVSFFINEEYVSEDVAPDMRLLDFLRVRGLKSVKCGCETTNCGLCTVWLEGEPVLSCAVPMCRVQGKYVTTLEGVLEQSAEFARCMAEEGAEQCGFCSPGLIMNVLALDRDCPDADDETIRRYLSNNLCRCTGYASQARAIRRFLSRDRATGQAAMPSELTSGIGRTHEQTMASITATDDTSEAAGRLRGAETDHAGAVEGGATHAEATGEEALA